MPPGDRAVLAYIFAANVILETLREEVLPELVAEARSLNITWSEIGETLGVGDTAAQKRFGGSPGSIRTDRTIWEAKITEMTNDFAMRDMYEGFESLKAEVLEDLQGTTQADRMQYSFKLIRGALAAFEEVSNILNRPPEERGLDAFTASFTAFHNKVMVLANTLVTDPDQWTSVTNRAGQPAGPDSAHYYSPATYMFYALRLVALATNYVELDPGDGIDLNRRLEYYARANAILQTAIFVLSRPDIQSAWPEVSYPENLPKIGQGEYKSTETRMS